MNYSCVHSFHKRSVFYGVVNRVRGTKIKGVTQHCHAYRIQMFSPEMTKKDVQGSLYEDQHILEGLLKNFFYLTAKNC
jgi:hypothetical protein